MSKENTIEKAILALGRGQETFNDDDANLICEWISELYINEILLSLLRKDKINLCIKNGKVMVSINNEM